MERLQAGADPVDVLYDLSYVALLRVMGEPNPPSGVPTVSVPLPLLEGVLEKLNRPLPDDDEYFHGMDW
ncbi:hypothetical protein [Chelativorans salis]|uniref:Uncharacterized protein n=1 Tax=Chelativorans salis TaxID=2978478 RepID=A0ABT2LKP2_9HYPH|nr:hypothetical protein [Chelativorans sp. EGI FJ00035]MCT7374836.1 hypothetical protein [Chelativorans sp. EGI FJ00035]